MRFTARIPVISFVSLFILAVAFQTSFQGAQQLVDARRTIDLRHPNVIIELVDGSPGLEVQIIAEHQIMHKIDLAVSTAVRDSNGDWKSTEETFEISSDPATGIASADLEPGRYGITDLRQDVRSDGKISGRWGMPDPNGDVLPRQIIPFPVEVGMLTRITVTLGALRVQVMDFAGVIDFGAHVNLCCQERDAGGAVRKSLDCHDRSDDDCRYPNSDRGVLRNSSHDGYRTWYVGAGDYLVCVANNCPEVSVAAEGLATDLVVGANDVLDVQITSQVFH